MMTTLAINHLRYFFCNAIIPMVSDACWE